MPNIKSTLTCTMSCVKMSKMKVGIITHYYNSTNYGGNLQAYALVECLHKLGYDVEQICYKTGDDALFCANEKAKTRRCGFMKIFFSVFHSLTHLAYRVIVSKRKKEVLRFNKNSIKHSKVVYQKNTLSNLAEDYDVLISGSDQVWHPNAVCDAYLLNLGEKSKVPYKMSYAASFSVNELTFEQKKYYGKCLNNINAISVREDSAVQLVESICGKGSQMVLDPTLLLSYNNWNIVSSERKMVKKYLFCYFLGSLTMQNSKIRKFAKEKGLKIVSMPFLNSLRQKDTFFGDYKLFNVSPYDFISLIKNAEYVFTDSFHATVFSLIFKKNFFVFNRENYIDMNCRIYSLTDLFDTGDRFCDSKEKCTLEYIESLPPINYDREFPKFEAMKEKSINFLKDNLKKAEEKLNEVD